MKKNFFGFLFAAALSALSVFVYSAGVFADEVIPAAGEPAAYYDFELQTDTEIRYGDADVVNRNPLTVSKSNDVLVGYFNSDGKWVSFQNGDVIPADVDYVGVYTYIDNAVDHWATVNGQWLRRINFSDSDVYCHFDWYRSDIDTNVTTFDAVLNNSKWSNPELRSMVTQVFFPEGISVYHMNSYTTPKTLYTNYKVSTGGYFYKGESMTVRVDTAKYPDINRIYIDSFTFECERFVSNPSICQVWDYGFSFNNQDVTVISFAYEDVNVSVDPRVTLWAVDKFGGNNYYEDYISCYTTGLYIDVDIDDYINRKLIVNGKEVPMKQSGDRYYFYYYMDYCVSDLDIKLIDSPWSSSELSEYVTLDADEGISVIHYNSYYQSCSPDYKVPQGGYFHKSESVVIRASKALYPDAEYLMINGQAVECHVNDDYQWQIWTYDIPDDCSVLSVKFPNATSPGLRLTPGNSCIKLDWDKVNGAEYYIIYAYDGTSFWPQATTTSTTYTLGGLINGVTYRLCVQAYGGGQWSNISVENIQFATPAVPELYSPVASLIPGNGKIDLEWYSVPGAESYIIYAYDGSNFWPQGTTTDTSFTLNGLWNGTEYGLCVQAYGGGVWSDVTTDDIRYATPIAPHILTPFATLTPGDGCIKLDWQNVYGAEYYIIYAYDGANFWSQGTTTGKTFTLNGLRNGTEYGLCVQAYGSGAWSNITTDNLVYATPAAPEVTTPKAYAYPGNGCIEIWWDKISGAEYYIIYIYDGENFWGQGVTADNYYTLTGLTNGVKYKLCVQAYGGGIWSSISENDLRSATPQAPEITNPYVILTPGSGCINLKWDKVHGAEYYIIYAYDGTNFWGQGTTAGISYTLKGLTDGVTYGLCVQAYGGGQWSNISVSDVKYATAG